jgi:hypothetical protein
MNAPARYNIRMMYQFWRAISGGLNTYLGTEALTSLAVGRPSV